MDGAGGQHHDKARISQGEAGDLWPAGSSGRVTPPTKRGSVAEGLLVVAGRPDPRVQTDTAGPGRAGATKFQELADAPCPAARPGAMPSALCPLPVSQATARASERTELIILGVMTPPPSPP